jgi:glycosyltransferase involved in cell wall biosynthesis
VIDRQNQPLQSPEMPTLEPKPQRDDADVTHVDGGAPLVSIIIATYNRSNVVGYAIRSVLAQTHRDWELLVIGDGCTDDTADVVASFDDPRIRYVAIERVGDQSGPTNAGIRLARGRYIALLNHDDLWLPDHLTECIATLERTSADLTFSLQLEYDPDDAWRINAVYSEGFDPAIHPNASSWVFRRELAARVGKLVRRERVYTYPTRDWFWRALRAGATFVPTAAATVVVISATTRVDVYAQRQWREHAQVEAMVASDPRFRERRLIDALRHPRPTHLRALRLSVLLRAAAMRVIGRVAYALGFDPEGVYCYYKFPKKWGVLPMRGAVIAELYRRRGLDRAECALPLDNETSAFAPPVQRAAQSPPDRQVERT